MVGKIEALYAFGFCEAVYPSKDLSTEQRSSQKAFLPLFQRVGLSLCINSDIITWQIRLCQA